MPDLQDQHLGSFSTSTSQAIDKAIYRNRAQISDICCAMSNGFESDPKLAPSHLPLLSYEALAEIHAQSEDWRSKAHERALERDLDQMRAAEAAVSRYYVRLRGILDALDVPESFRSIDSNPAHVAWTEQKARELVKKAENCAVYARTAQSAEKRVDLLERYVKACDAKRVPYNWNVFRMPTADLHQHVLNVENMEKLTRCDCNPERVAWFDERTRQETEQSLRWHAKCADETRKLIGQYAGGRIDINTAEKLLDVLLARPQCGEAKPDSQGWIVWEWGYKPQELPDDAIVDIMLHNGAANTLEAGVVEWSDVKQYRHVK